MFLLPSCNPKTPVALEPVVLVSVVYQPVPLQTSLVPLPCVSLNANTGSIPSIVSVALVSIVTTPVPVFHIQTLNPAPRVAAAVKVAVNVPEVQFKIVPLSPETTV